MRQSALRRSKLAGLESKSMERPLHPSGERNRWNQKYREANKALNPKLPDSFLPHAFSKYILPVFPNGGSALDLAGGAGRHAIWLAKQGWEVTLIDISETGVEQARQDAGALATHIRFVVDDLTHFKASQTELERGFDVVIVFFYLERKIFSELLQAIHPGGLLVYKTYTLAQAKLKYGPTNPAHLLKPDELLQLAANLHVLHYREDISERATAELVARKQN
jgi:tellurite methyltransferase